MKKVLVVDNNPVLLKAMSAILAREGCEVETAGNGLNALEVLETFTPDIVFTDLVMPLIGGDQLCRIIRSNPKLAGVFLVAGLAVLGLPGLSQFVSEILVIISAFQYHWWVGAIAVTSIVLAAWYILWMYQRTFTGPGVSDVEPVADLDRREIGSVAPLLLALVLFGFFPGPLLDVINPAATSILEQVGVQDPAPTVAGAEEGH